ncbi:MAG: helix-hairpin-helix domain-containing protein [Firmicutes bacterium]|nr:helix-hairpin-helix domain-containing protein [Bacillota bacterium]
MKIFLEFVKDNIYVILGGLCVVVVGIIFMASRGTSGGRIIQAEDIIYMPAAQNIPAPTAPEAELPPMPPEPIAEEPTTIVVHIVGEVNSPGVYSLYYGARVDDVLQMAGGETQNADLARVNLAAFLQDAMQIIIPAIGDDITDVFIYDDTASARSGVSSAQTDGLININTATVAELQTLPGVGPVLATNIIEFRESHGGFSSVDELINVSRIGQATLDRLRDLVTVGQ